MLIPAFHAGKATDVDFDSIAITVALIVRRVLLRPSRLLTLPRLQYIRFTDPRCRPFTEPGFHRTALDENATHGLDRLAGVFGREELNKAEATLTASFVIAAAVEVCYLADLRKAIVFEGLLDFFWTGFVGNIAKVDAPPLLLVVGRFGETLSMFTRTLRAA